MGDLSAHFDTSEFRDHRTGAVVEIDDRLVSVLERIRALTGRPLSIVSGYRSPSTNRAVGGAPDSQHLHGRAADIPRGRCTVAQAREAGAVGVGYCGPWVVHVDTRPGPPVTFKDC